jgi:outer membrane protein OmpA-like peptidoglycan-associated protein
MNKLTSHSLALILAAGAATGAFAADAPRTPPSKDDIIKALTAPVGDVATTRGFAVHPAVTGAANVTGTGSVARETTGTPVSLNQAPPRPAARASIDEPILFALNSAEIHPMSREALKEIAAALSSPQLKDKKILLEGHTDATGTPDRNLILSQERADAVRNYLVQEAGIAPDRLSTIGKGQSEPIDPANPLAPENRRVVLVNMTN